MKKKDFSNFKCLKMWMDLLLALAYQDKDVAFRFIIEYSSLRDFYRPLGNNNNRSIFILWGFLKDDILACVETWD
jgi:hypothetical protein